MTSPTLAPSITTFSTDVNGVLVRGVPATVTGPRFQGDPGVGKLLVGVNGSAAAWQSLSSWDTTMAPTGRHSSTVRIYCSDIVVPSGKIGEMRAWTAAGIMPMFDFNVPQPSGTTDPTHFSWPPTDILTGSHDSDLETMFSQIDTFAGPIFACFTHEPKDNYPVAGGTTDGTTADNYRSIYRYIINYYNTNHHKNIVWVSPLFNWWIFGGNAADFRNWHPNWSGTALINPLPVKVDGIDMYNPIATFSSSNVNDSWAVSAAKFLNARSAVGFPALPWIIGELGPGMTLYPSGTSTGNTPGSILADMYAQGPASGLVAVCAWNGFGNGDKWAYTTAGGDPDGSRTTAWRTLMAQPNVVLT